MAKFFQISLLIGFLFVSGCFVRSDANYQKADTTYGESARKDAKSDLSALDEPFANFDYTSVLDKYSGALSQNMSITKFRNFIVFSQVADDTTYNIIDKDIRFTIDAMTNSYLKVLPDKVTPLFLFADYASYRNFAVNVLDADESDLSPYGYFKISKNIIVIRFVSWKGSPSHEVTHAMLQNDFPDIPSWFNEGLAALHEKSTYKNGNLVGDFSWRIISLRRAFNEDTYTGLTDLMNTNDDELYGKRSSFYYAQSRYLLMYIQQKGLLSKYYRYFRDNYEQDHTGITQLTKITGENLEQLDGELVDFINSFKQEFR